MEKDLQLVVWGALAGLISALALELTKHHLERIRTIFQESQERQKERSERIEEFYLGRDVEERPGQAPDPAWLRQVSFARRYPLARLGLRSDEDYATDFHFPVERTRGKRITLLKRLCRDQTRPRRPSTQPGAKFLLGSAHLLGRGNKCDIQILDPGVSLLHAFLRFEGDRYVLYDLGSTCGTFVNGEPVGITGRPLEGGELIQMGSTIFEFERVVKDGE